MMKDNLVKIIAYIDNFYANHGSKDREEYYVLCGEDFFPSPYRWHSFHVYYNPNKDNWSFQYCNAESIEDLKKYLTKEECKSSIREVDRMKEVEVDNEQLLKDLVKMQFLKYSKWFSTYFVKKYLADSSVHKVKN